MKLFRVPSYRGHTFNNDAMIVDIGRLLYVNEIEGKDSFLVIPLNDKINSIFIAENGNVVIERASERNIVFIISESDNDNVHESAMLFLEQLVKVAND